jgi:3-methyladenine DNA glycosylase AlkD
MKRPEQLAREIQAYCAAHADPEGARKFERYFREGYDAWGMLDRNHPFFNEQQAAWSEAYAGIGLGGFLRVGEILFASGKYEEASISIRFVENLLPQVDAATALSLSRWFEAGLRNWAHADVLCNQLLSPLLRDGRLSAEDLAPWRSSPLRFQRRAVAVALITVLPALKKGEAASPADRRTIRHLLDFLEPMMLDQERVVHQGLGWFLREAWKKDAGTVEPFLLRFKDTAARLVYQYATEKMTAEGKARFRAVKQAPRKPAKPAVKAGKAARKAVKKR